MASESNGNGKLGVELFLLSLAALFIELLVIRWLSSDIRAFTVFRTFPLVTCFVGMGAGFAVANDKAFRFTPLAMAGTLLILKVAESAGVDYWRFPAASVFNWQILSAGSDDSIVFLIQCMIALTIILAGPFAMCFCIASRMGVLFNSLKPLNAYSLNLLGSFVGSVLFAICSYFGLAPIVLLLIASIPVLAYLAGGGKPNWVWMLPILAVPLLSFWQGGKESSPLIANLMNYHREKTQTFWSPYHRIDVNVYECGEATANPLFLGLELGVNRAFYQYFLNDTVDVNNLPGDLTKLFYSRRKFYGLPFGLSKAKDVLVVGSGTGQNVGAALENGAESVDAVDIDPVILQVGKKYNPRYSQDNVHLICDDARHFFGQTKKKYDLVVFTFLDSQAVVGNGSSVRLDAYVYTEESFKQALKLLKPDGKIAVSYAVFMPWMGERLYKTMESAAGYAPLVMQGAGSDSTKVTTFFLLGEPVRNKLVEIPAGWKSINIAAPEKTKILTDDWPYLYVRTDVFDLPYLLVVAEILLISSICGRNLISANKDTGNLEMFFLGSAFLLLELHAISLLSLLFGSTWLTSAIVINCILLMIFAANIFVIKSGEWLARSLPVVYFSLFFSIVASFILPTQKILEAYGTQLGSAYVSAVTILPMGIAGIIFACSFSQRQNSSKALAYNLYGALFGGLLEYLSNYTGIKGLELIALALYAIAFACHLISGKSHIAESTEIAAATHTH